ncbi:MAG: HRDC domain-containing protein [Pseudomonadota bacterium]|nr:HRDC domain-containing protein [Pseudomonadota bacterium]
MPTSKKIPELINNQKDLDALCKIISANDYIAIDTEFLRTNTFAPKLGLLQLHTVDQISCVDPLVDMNMQELWELIFDPKRMCIFHSAKQDMEVIWFEQNALVGQLIDTQICAGLLGHPAQIGYAGITADLLNINISKSQTRTDWCRRPLSKDQLEYALEDVKYLPKLHEILFQKLRELGRSEWAVEDSSALLNHKLYQPDTEMAWKRVKSIPFLPLDQQARARAIAALREHLALKSNQPRQWILSDKALIQIAQENPSTEESLLRIKYLSSDVTRNHGQSILASINAANQSYAIGELNFQQLKPERDQDKSKYRKLSSIVKDKAEQLAISSEVIASKRDIQALLRNDPQCRLTRGWRKEIVGDELISEI